MKQRGNRMETNATIYVAGHDGLVGSAIMRRLGAEGFSNLITAPLGQLDLRCQRDCEAFFERTRPQYVFLAAAKVGGIHANNTRRAEFIYDNLMISANVIHASWQFGVRKLLFLGSSCIYPRNCPQPMREEYLLTGPLEATNEPYAIAKIAGLKMCESYHRQYGCDFVSLMPTNLYGMNDNFDPETSHVLPALIRRFVEARQMRAPSVTIWGTGAPLREFMHVDDLADAALFVMQHVDGGGFWNVGTGREITIRDLALLIREVVGYEGELVFDATRPDGTPRKLLDVSRLAAMGWTPKRSLRAGLEDTVRWFEAHQGDRTSSRM